MFMLIGIAQSGPLKSYYRPGGWRYSTMQKRWVQNDNAYCGCESYLKCKGH